MTTLVSTEPRRRRWAFRARVMGLLVATGVLVGACTSQADGDENTPGFAAESAAANEGDPVLDFYQCLRDNGLEVQDPTRDGATTLQEQVDTEDPVVQGIIEECSEETGSNGRITVGGEGGQMGENLADTEDLIVYVDCLREHGIDMPDPDADGRLSMPEGMDRNSTELREAGKACAGHLDGGKVMVDGGDGGGVVKRDN